MNDDAKFCANCACAVDENSANGAIVSPKPKKGFVQAIKNHKVIVIVIAAVLAAVICSLSVVGIINANSWTTYTSQTSNDSGGYGIFEVSFKKDESLISNLRIYEEFSPNCKIANDYHWVDDEVDELKASMTKEVVELFGGLDFIKFDVNVDVNEKDLSYSYSRTTEINDLLDMYNYSRFKKCLDKTYYEFIYNIDMDDVMDDAYMTAYKLESELISNGYKKQ